MKIIIEPILDILHRVIGYLRLIVHACTGLINSVIISVRAAA